MKLLSLFRQILFFLVFIPIVVLANNSLSFLADRQYVLGLDLGVAKSTNLGSSSTFHSGYSTFSYSPNSNNDTVFMPGVSVSTILKTVPLYTLQVGASVHSLSNMSVKGNLAQGIFTPYYTSTYSYHVNSYQYLVEAKLRRQIDNRYFPYVYVGLGVASNRAFNFATAVPGYLTVTPNYSNQTTNAFAYSIGLGVDYLVMPKLSIGLGYRFLNLGKVALGSGMIRNTNVGSQLTQSNLYMNTLLAELNYFI